MVLKKLCAFLTLVAVLISGFAVSADSEPPVIAVYSSSFKTEQGINNWYFCEYTSSGAKELKYISGRWQNGVDTLPNISSDGGTMNPGVTDVAQKFVAPEKGMVRLKGSVNMPMPDSTKGTGVTATIYKNSNKVWSKNAYYKQNADYNFIISVKKGDELYFCVGPNGTNYYDWTIWWPTVEYLGIDYVSEDESYTYFGRNNGESVELSYDEKEDLYYAPDKAAFIGDRDIMPTEEYSLVKRFTVTEDGRYRVLAKVEAADIRSGGNVLTVYQNGKEVWRQLFPDDEDGVADVRMLSAAGDVIDVEMSVSEFSGYNHNKWRCDISKYVGTLFCEGDTSSGHNCGTVREFSLGSLVGTSMDGGMEYYVERRDLRVPMVYNSSKSRWENGDPDFVATVTSGLANKGQIGYVSNETVFPGDGTDSVIVYTVSESGIMRICGDLTPKGGDGVVSKIFKNDKLLWSSRVGGERPVRWDEPYDVSYFQNIADVTFSVTQGDRLTFSFNQWRRSSNDEVSIKNLMLKYISGDVMSETTKWKLKNSTVIDTKTKTVYQGGEKSSVFLVTKDGTNYISKSDAVRIFGSEALNGAETAVFDQRECVSVREVCENADKNVLWTANRLIIAYGGIPVMFGYSEISEIETAIEGGVFFE